MAKIIIPQKKTATLELQLNGKDIHIEFPVDSMAGYRQAAEVIKQYRQLADKQKILTDETLTEEQATEILDQSVGLMESFRDAVRVAIRDEQYNKHLKSVEDDIPFTAWLQILSVIIQEYGAYFQDITSTEGEL
jgi:hypothetical protein